MVNFGVEEGKEIVVKCDGFLLFRQTWHNEMSYQDNLAAAVLAVERIKQENIEKERISAQKMKKEQQAKHTQLREVVQRLRSEHMQCNCDLDRWTPEQNTGHSWVCRIHKAAIQEVYRAA